MTKQKNTAAARKQEKHVTPSKGFNSDELFLQPWFLPRRNECAMRVLMPPHYRRRMSAFFEDYGCMICGTYDGYFANGMCHNCNRKVRAKLRKCLKRRMKDLPNNKVSSTLERQKGLAKRLLSRFSGCGGASSQPYRIEPAPIINPVDEFLAPQPK